MPSVWRTETHWYRPIRLTDEARFYADMQAGWRAVGALPPLDALIDEVYLTWYPVVARLLTARSPVLDRFP